MRADLHHPYSFHIVVDEGRAGDEWRQDHMVVPTVPIAVWLKAHLDKRALYDKRFEDLVRDIGRCFSGSTSDPGVVTGQSSTYNGTVNMNYIHEGIAEVARLAHATSSRPRGWRARAVLTRPRPTVSKITASPMTALLLAVVLLLVSPFIGWIYESVGFGPDHDKAQVVIPNQLHPGTTRVERLKSGQSLTITVAPEAPAGPPHKRTPAPQPRP